MRPSPFSSFFFFNDTATTEIYTPFPTRRSSDLGQLRGAASPGHSPAGDHSRRPQGPAPGAVADRKSTRLNSSHLVISYAVFCLKKKKKKCTESIRVLDADARLLWRSTAYISTSL